MTREELLKKANSLPKNPGVYIMKDKSSTVIYVGKAKALKNRVTSYFRHNGSHTVKTLKLVDNIFDFDYILTNSEFEALVLECSLIKQYSPKYNILLKDDKGYSYIRVTKEDYPRISEVKKVAKDSATYMGPYVSSSLIAKNVSEALKIFKLPSCNKVFPRDFGKERPCLNYHIGICNGVCTGKISKADYNESVNSALRFLKGDSLDIIKDMERLMAEYSEKLMFEKAAEMRDRISAIKRLNSKQKVYAKGILEQDVFAVVKGVEKLCLSVLRFQGGRLCDSEVFILDDSQELENTRYSLIMQFYTLRSDIPKRVTVDGEVADSDLLSRWLSEKSSKKVLIKFPQKGEQMQLVRMCRDNAVQHLALYEGKKMSQTAALSELAQVLGLAKAPQYIESYDISHTGGQDNVAGMVVFKDGIPYKKAYKRFAIKSFSGQDDYASMQEVLSRRFTHYFEDEEDSTFKIKPDLILLDGGKGQVNAVAEVLEKLGLSDIPLFGMVKDSKHRTRAIATGGGEIQINSLKNVFKLVTSIQDEVHRFSIEYHRKKHGKRSISTTLTSIEGIGESKARSLLKHFGSVNKVACASVEELCAVEGIGEQRAKIIYDYFSDRKKSQS